MRKVRRILVIALAAAVLGGIGWFVLRPHEPPYAGKPLRFWMQTLDSVSPGFSPPPVWEELGTNELPVLIKALEIRDSRWRNIYPRLYGRLWPMTPRWVLRRLPRPLDTENIAINALMRLFPSTDDYRTNEALLCSAVPTLVHLLKTDKSFPVREMAASELGVIGMKGEAVTSALKDALNDSSVGVRISAANALERIGPQAAASGTRQRDAGPLNRLDGKTAEK